MLNSTFIHFSTGDKCLCKHKICAPSFYIFECFGISILKRLKNLLYYDEWNTCSWGRHPILHITLALTGIFVLFIYLVKIYRLRHNCVFHQNRGSKAVQTLCGQWKCKRRIKNTITVYLDRSFVDLHIILRLFIWVIKCTKLSKRYC